MERVLSGILNDRNMSVEEIYDRQGGDITAEDMIEPTQEPSEIRQFFDDTTLFITGASGFIGKLLLEKTLRSCPGIKKIYILMRAKKGKTPEKRLEELFQDIVFARLLRQNPRAIDKVTLIAGDLTQPDMGLNVHDRATLIKEINCIFHCAAIVRFDEQLKFATYVNIRATRDLLQIAREAKDLRSFVYVSTAYSNCNQKLIDERFYDTHISAEKLINLVDDLDNDTLNQLTPILLKDWPNTYAFSKAVAENMIGQEGKGLPLAVVRPSIVLSTASEPMAGWIDNYYGACGVSVGSALGLIRVVQINADYSADVVPADYVVNCIIASAWETGMTKILNKNEELAKDIKSEQNGGVVIYNYVCSNENPLSWESFQTMSIPYLKDNHSTMEVWEYFLIKVSNKTFFTILAFLLHLVPAYIIDLFRLCIGRRPQMVKAYSKIHKFLEVLSNFTTKQWKFRNNNTQMLWQRLNVTDQKSFEFSMRRLDWDTFFSTYVRGARVYLLKDPLDTIPQGTAHHRRLQILHYLVCTIFFLGLLKFVHFIVSLVI